MNSALKRKTKSALKLMLDLLDEKEADIKHDYGEKVEVVVFDMLADLSFEIEKSEEMEKQMIEKQDKLVNQCIGAAVAGKLYLDINQREFIDRIDNFISGGIRIGDLAYSRLLTIHNKIETDFFEKELNK